MSTGDEELGRLLQRTMGLNAQAVKAANLGDAIEHRMGEHGIRSWAKYLAVLRCSRKERLSLVESVELPAVSFFQHPEPFESLKRWVTNHWLARPSKNPLRVLSVPCATGEEPYSLAITLLESGLLPSQFHIDAADINDRALRHAAAAVYPDRALSSAAESIRERYFQKESDGHRLCPPVRNQVSLLKTDLLGHLSLAEDYDIIFGRSLMIYFVPEAQQRILKRLSRLLQPGGLLIVGPSMPGSRQRIRIPAWTEGLDEAQSACSCNSLSGASLAAPRVSGLEDRQKLKQATELFEAHRLQEAADLCVRILEEFRASAQAIYLLGRIAEEEGRRVEAREFFRRALYLQPRHRQAQAHLLQIAPSRNKKPPTQKRPK